MVEAAAARSMRIVLVVMVTATLLQTIDCQLVVSSAAF